MVPDECQYFVKLLFWKAREKRRMKWCPRMIERSLK